MFGKKKSEARKQIEEELKKAGLNPKLAKDFETSMKATKALLNIAEIQRREIEKK